MQRISGITFMLIILFSLPLFSSACGALELQEEDIQSVTLTVGGPGQNEYTVVTFQDPDNFKHFLAIEKVLDKYDPKKHMIKTWKLDVKFEYHLTSGETVIREYKGIRPVDEFLETLYNTKEYQERTIPLFKLDKSHVKQVRANLSRASSVTVLALAFCSAQPGFI